MLKQGAQTPANATAPALACCRHQPTTPSPGFPGQTHEHARPQPHPQGGTSSISQPKLNHLCVRRSLTLKLSPHHSACADVQNVRPQLCVRTGRTAHPKAGQAPRGNNSDGDSELSAHRHVAGFPCTRVRRASLEKLPKLLIFTTRHPLSRPVHPWPEPWPVCGPQRSAHPLASQDLTVESPDCHFTTHRTGVQPSLNQHR